MNLLTEITNRAARRSLTIHIDDLVFGTISLGQRSDGERGGTVSRKFMEIYVIPRSVACECKFAELMHITENNGKKHGYFTKDSRNGLDEHYNRYCLGRFPYELLEEIEEPSNNNGKRFEKLGLLLFGGYKTDRNTDVIDKIDIVTAEKRAKKQMKYCGFSVNARLNPRSSYSGCNISF